MQTLAWGLEDWGPYNATACTFPKDDDDKVAAAPADDKVAPADDPTGPAEAPEFDDSPGASYFITLRPIGDTGLGPNVKGKKEEIPLRASGCGRLWLQTEAMNPLASKEKNDHWMGISTGPYPTSWRATSVVAMTGHPDHSQRNKLQHLDKANGAFVVKQEQSSEAETRERRTGGAGTTTGSESQI